MDRREFLKIMGLSATAALVLLPDVQPITEYPSEDEGIAIVEKVQGNTATVVMLSGAGRIKITRNDLHKAWPGDFVFLLDGRVIFGHELR